MIEVKQKTKQYEYNKRWRKKHPNRYSQLKHDERKRYYHKYPVRYAYSRRVHDLLKQGRIEKTPCIVCGSRFQVQASSLRLTPFNPLWLCDSCNKHAHKVNNELSKPVSIISTVPLTASSEGLMSILDKE